MKRQAAITAKTPVTLLSIDGREFLRWQTARPKLYNTIICQIIQKHYMNRDMLTHFSSSASDAAGAQYLSYLYKIYKKACHDPGYTGPVRIWETHQEIGTAIVKNVRSVDRMISSFKRKAWSASAVESFTSTRTRQNGCPSMACSFLRLPSPFSSLSRR